MPLETVPTHKPGDLFTNSLGMKFAWVPPGSFMMGSPTTEKDRHSSETPHRVTQTKGFHLGIHQITQEEWLTVMVENPDSRHFIKKCNLPVEQASWFDAVNFLQRPEHCGKEEIVLHD